LLTKLENAAPEDSEFLRDLLDVAVKAKLADQAQHLLERVVKVTPNVPELPELRIKLDMLLQRNDAAIAGAREILKSDPNNATAQILLAEALVRSDPKPEHEKELADMAAKHPDNPNFLRRHVLYLAKVKRLPEGLASINQAIARSKLPVVKTTLLNMAVRIPLEEANADLAEQQLKLHQAALNNPFIVDYMTGRILFLRKDYVGAVEQFQKVIESPTVAETEPGRVLRAECQSWQQQIFAINANRDLEKKGFDNLKKAEAEMKKIKNPQPPKPAPQSQAGDKPAAAKKTTEKKS
jgi:tetratricopeptide (TPR) repeat protein